MQHNERSIGILTFRSMEAFHAGLPLDVRNVLRVLELYDEWLKVIDASIRTAPDLNPAEALIVAELTRLKEELRKVADKTGRKLAQRMRIQAVSECRECFEAMDELRGQAETLLTRITGLVRSLAGEI